MEKLSVLLVDDDEHILRYFEKRDGQFHLELASSGRIGLAICVEELPDILFTDLQMPDMHGIELMRRARVQAQLQRKEMFIAAVSGVWNPELQKAARTSGANMLIAKPFTWQFMLRIINNRKGQWAKA